MTARRWPWHLAIRYGGSLLRSTTASSPPQPRPDSTNSTRPPTRAAWTSSRTAAPPRDDSPSPAACAATPPTPPACAFAAPRAASSSSAPPNRPSPSLPSSAAPVMSQPYASSSKTTDRRGRPVMFCGSDMIRNNHDDAGSASLQPPHVRTHCAGPHAHSTCPQLPTRPSSLSLALKHLPPFNFPPRWTLLNNHQHPHVTFRSTTPRPSPPPGPSNLTSVSRGQAPPHHGDLPTLTNLTPSPSQPPPRPRANQQERSFPHRQPGSGLHYQLGQRSSLPPCTRQYIRRKACISHPSHMPPSLDIVIERRPPSHPTRSRQTAAHPRAGFCLTFLPKGEVFVTTVALLLALGGSLSAPLYPKSVSRQLVAT